MKGFVSVEILLLGSAILGLFYALVQPTVDYTSQWREELSTMIALRSLVSQLSGVVERTVTEENVEVEVFSYVEANVVVSSTIKAELNGLYVDIPVHAPVVDVNLSIKRGLNRVRGTLTDNGVLLEVTG